MRIKQIELVGFKSFADKTVLRLHNGVTCIVGPNGCGKSNIVDAFKWVLGEQSVKSLRGEKMEEVIFQGSAAVKQKGLAEVSLHINGSTPENGNAQDGTSVSRRLYRSGESEYLLNENQCRLKDVRDIFLDTGLDVKSYSILDQGKITEIINSKAQDRRFILEEVAGVMKYKVRKTEALSKLDSSKQNLQRINDITYEVKRQINSLDRQVKKAERFKRLNGELKIIELRVAKREHIRLAGILRELSTQTEYWKETDSLKRSTLSTLENQIEAKRLELAGKEKALADIENSLYSKEKEISESEKHIAIIKTAMENRRADMTRLALQQSEFEIKKEDLVKKLGEIESRSSALSTDMSGLTENIRTKKELLSSIELSIGDKESELEEKRKELFRISEMVSQKRNELHKLQTSFETLQYRESTSLRDMETVRNGIASTEESVKSSEEHINELKHKLMALQTEKDAARAETEHLHGEIESKKGLLATEREALASNIARFRSLKELTFDKSLMDVLSEAVPASHQTSDPAGEAPGLFLDSTADYPVLSDVISTEKEYEKAIEAALYGKINSILLRKIEDILAASAVIREKNLGRTALLYSAFSIEGQTSSPCSTPTGIIGKAADFVSFENSEMRDPASMILEDTFIVKDLQTAVAIRSQETSRHCILVTLDGEVIDRDGVILAGQGKDILKRKREIKELNAAVLKQQMLISTIENELSTAVTTLSGKRESLKNMETTLVSAEKELDRADHSLKNLHEEAERKQRKLAYLSSEIATLAEENESLRTLIATKSEEISLSEQEQTTVNGSITMLQDALGSIRTDYETARSEVTDLQLTITSYREKVESLQREKATIANTLKELEESREAAVRQEGEAEQKISELSLELQQYEESIKTLVLSADTMRREKTSQKEALDTEGQALVAEGNSLKDIRLEIDGLSLQLSEANAKTVENRLRAENIENGIAQKYGLEIKDEEIITEGFDSAQDEEQITQLNEKIRELGPVNLGTIEEYEELKNRYDFLTRQQQDLTMSIAELEEAISRINASTRRKLREAYDTLREKFIGVFTTLFGGGKADIILTEEENILESGLEIIAQPPGKKLQNLNLLSGGEKALTSLALLFSGFLIKPSPLCILDEVDAPLDESNTVRFAHMIRSLSKDTQFIVITHNRATMEVADYLYGITMEEPGVSKAISLQFAEMEEKA